MSFLGKVTDGVVVFENGTPPEGALVRVEVVAAQSNAPAPADPPTIWEKLRTYSGKVQNLPHDFARNHDHYIHRGPKK